MTLALSSVTYNKLHLYSFGRLVDLRVTMGGVGDGGMTGEISVEKYERNGRCLRIGNRK